MTNFYDTKWDRPYLTPSLAVTLLTKSAYHAQQQCPFYVEPDPTATQAMKEGAIVDCLVLGGDPGVTVLDVDNYQTKAAKKLRDESVNPIKRKDYDRCRAAAQEIYRHLYDFHNIAARAITAAYREDMIKRRLFWHGTRNSQAVHYSTEPDVVVPGDCVLDLKRTRVAPTGRNWQRHCASMYYHVQAAAHLEATGCKRFGWIVVEADPPHAVVVHWANDEFLKLGRRDWSTAQQIWYDCVYSGDFPSYESEDIGPMPWQIDDLGEQMQFTE